MSLKEQLLSIGLSEEIVQKVMGEVIDGNYIPKSRFNEVNEENKSLKKSITEYDKQLEDLKKSSGDNTALQEQIALLQQQNAQQKKTHETEIANLKLDNAIEIALSGAKAKNSKALKAMIDMSKVKLTEDGKLTGFDEQVESLKKSDEYMFDIPAPQQFTGFQPGVSAPISSHTNAGYEARLADARKNNNQLEVIKIKQEAANEGVILI